MKCKYCNADIEQDAQFCPNCGKDLSKFNKCIKCGELLDSDTVFCPHCGTEQPHEEKIEVKGNGFKKWLLILPIIVLLVGAGAWYLVSEGFSFGDTSNRVVAEAVDSDSIAVVEEVENDPVAVEAAESRQALMEGIEELESTIEEKTKFINEMYEDFFENRNFNTENSANLKKYLSPNVLERILIECPYEGSEGEKAYIVDCFRDGSLTFERPDYGDKVIKREIHSNDGDWFEVTNYWDVVKTPVKVRLKIDSYDGGLKVVDFR